MSGVEEEAGAESSASARLLAGNTANGGEAVETAVALPLAAVPGTVAADEKQPLAYWQAVISALSPEKQAAAWQFFQERELGLAKGATDTLSGLVLLLEANGLFMEACAKRLADTAALPLPCGEPRNGGQVLPILEGDHDKASNVESYPAGQPAAGVAPRSDGAASPALLSDPSSAPAKASTLLGRTSTLWFSAILLALGAGGIGAWLGVMHTKANADLQVQAQVRQVRTWLDVDEQARAILMSRKAELAFGFARDPSLGNRKVYTLTIKGAPILRAGKTKEGAGVIAFDASGPDLIP